MKIEHYQQARQNEVAHPNPRTSNEVLNQIGPLSAQAHEATKPLVEKLDKVEKDRTLSNEGKAQAKAKVANELVPTFRFIGGHQTKTAELVGRLNGTVYGFQDLPKEESETKALTRELRAQEIRAGKA